MRFRAAPPQTLADTIGARVTIAETAFFRSAARR